MSTEQEKVLQPCFKVAGYVVECHISAKGNLKEAMCSDYKNKGLLPFFKTAWYSGLYPLVNTQA